MSDERTEAATPKRRSKSRSEGQIARSADFNSALTLSAGMFFLFKIGPFVMERLKTILVYTFTNLQPSHIDSTNFNGLMAPFFIMTGDILMPLLIFLFVFTVIVLRLQIGHLLNFSAILPKFDKLSPMKMVTGLKDMFNIFKPQKIVELLKSFIKLAVIGGFCWNVIEARKDELLALLGADLTLSFATITSILSQIIINICMALLVIGIIDKFYQNYEFEKSIKMTKNEVKDERKNTEGDPLIKGKIKSAQMQFAKQIMMSKIPKADVIVTNPTHYAVAISYNTSIAPAPQVVTKGVDFIAFKIREIAEYNNIPIIENPPLARTLYKLVPLDGLVPPELYIAVAEVLAFVYKKNKVR